MLLISTLSFLRCPDNSFLDIASVARKKGAGGKGLCYAELVTNGFMYWAIIFCNVIDYFRFLIKLISGILLFVWPEHLDNVFDTETL